MATRGVFQLRKLTVLYCEYGGSSKGAREFIRHQIVDFASKTPAAEVVTELRPGRHPYISADYETGENKAIGIKNITPSEIMEYAMTLRNSSGRKVSSGSYTPQLVVTVSAPLKGALPLPSTVPCQTTRQKTGHPSKCKAQASTRPRPNS